LGGKRRLYKTAKESVDPFGLNYSGFIHLLDKNKIQLNRKVLADLAISDPVTLSKIIEQIK
jgi:large subunit ribosomal protein L20